MNRLRRRFHRCRLPELGLPIELADETLHAQVWHCASCGALWAWHSGARPKWVRQ